MTIRIRSLAPAALALAALAGLPSPASAAWLGLDDGDYLVNLHCDSSTVIACPSDIGGTITLAGGQMTAMNFTVNGDPFVGDPFDAVVDGSLVDTESSTLSGSPVFNFLSLRLITDGQIGPYGVGDRWWVYCNNNGNNCTPNTTGLWTAQRAGTVSEPALPALVLAGGLAAAWLRRRRD